MKIGIDIDGVILDFESRVRCYAELYDLLELHKNGITNENEYLEAARYQTWNEEEVKNFRKHFIEITKKSELMPYAKEVIELLKNDGHELIVITARGITVKDMKQAGEEKFKEFGLQFDKIYWATENKLEICKKENIDIMIDDRPDTCREISKNKIKTLYFRNVNIEKLEQNDYLKEVNNWGEIYRYIYNLKMEEN